MEIQNSRKSIWLPVAFALVMAGGIFIGQLINRNSHPSKFTIYPRNDKVSNVIDYISEEYVDTVNRNKISDKAITSILETLDPQSVYIPASELQRMNEPLEGNFFGIGVQFNLQADTIVIVNTVANGPSQMLGILAGDRIIKVNDSLVAGIKLVSDDVVKKLKGPQGTKVKVSILRKGIKKLLDFEIVRSKIPLYSVDVSYMVAPGVGFIKINQFARTTYDEFIAGVSKLHELGMKKLIVDLRANGGGYMDAATRIADEFFGNKELIVYTQGKSRPRQDIKATPGGVCLNDSVVILLDEWSASASEILAGAIQDNDRGLIIGRRSFGKGLVQEQIVLADGSAIRLTVARYYTPSGRCIQKPYNHGYDEYYNELHTRYVHGELMKADSIKFADSLAFHTPKGKILYAGGGIMPDVFIPIDTMGYTSYFAEVRNRGLMYSFAFQYADQNRAKLSGYKDIDQLEKYLDNIKLLDDFVNFSSKKGIVAKPKEIQVSKEIILTQVKAYIARDILDNAGFYPIISRIDNTLQKAVEIINKEN
jgi:carboxyl-terminal processing protease